MGTTTCSRADPVELWSTPPFEPSERDGNFYARGASDDKGQMYMHIKAVEALFAVYGKLPVNVKFLIEGEEEVGGESISEYVPKNKQKLSADVALVPIRSCLPTGFQRCAWACADSCTRRSKRRAPPRICTRHLRRRCAKRCLRLD